MKMDTDFHMVKGEGETGYINNSRLQRKALFETKRVLEKAVTGLCSAVQPPPGNLLVADLGCSSGENTLIFISEVINAIRGYPLEVQFYLNDLPGNDFNYMFRSLENFKKSIAEEHQGGTPPSFYISGLPGTRLFPSRSVHLFHSTYCLHWRSQVDLLLFLRLRYEELVLGGQMVLTFLGRKNEDVYDGDLNHLYGLLAQSVQSLVHKGLVQEEKLDAFNLPIYGPLVDEVKSVVRASCSTSTLSDSLSPTGIHTMIRKVIVSNIASKVE